MSISLNIKRLIFLVWNYKFISSHFYKIYNMSVALRLKSVATFKKKLRTICIKSKWDDQTSIWYDKWSMTEISRVQSHLDFQLFELTEFLNGINISTSGVDIVACMLPVPSIITSVTWDWTYRWDFFRYENIHMCK